MTSTDLYNIIKLRLAKSVPTSVIRCGDGEAILLNGFNDKEKLEWLFKRQLGYIPAVPEIFQIRNNLIEAYRSADIIGMPESKRTGLNEYWYRCHRS